MTYTTITMNPGAGGDSVASDTISSTKFPRHKISYGAEGFATDVSPATPLPVRGGDSIQIASTTVSWANSDVVNTVKNVALDLPGSVNPGKLLMVIIRNPSAETALICQVKHEYVDPNGGATRYADLSTPGGQATFIVLESDAVPSSPDGQAFFIEGGLPLALGGRLTIKNASAVGAGGAFTASVVVHALSGV